MREAKRQLELLTCQNVRVDESDFSAYRYLASEGFLPGYNFPALPVRAFVSSRSEGEFIARSRFLAINEFGPDNVIYHEGAKYQINRVWLTAQDPEQRFLRARLCQQCGYLHEGEAVNDERCQNCDAELETAGLYLAHLLEMPDRRHAAPRPHHQRRGRAGADGLRYPHQLPLCPHSRRGTAAPSGNHVQRCGAAAARTRLCAGSDAVAHQPRLGVAARMAAIGWRCAAGAG
jgi:hypothetical protein